MNVPVKLKSECTNQIDQQLLSLGCSAFIGMTILPNIVEDHISTSIVLEALNQIEEIEYEWKVLIGNFDVNCPNETLLCLTHNGDSFLLSQKKAVTIVLSVITDQAKKSNPSGSPIKK